jgi:Fe-S oxidoreductase
MLAATRLKLNQRRAEKERHATGQAGFQKMSEAVKVLSRVVLKTPHIALLCLEVLNRIGARYKVFGGPANCCGILQYRAGDAKASGRIGGNTVAGFAGTGASRVLTWCPTCNIQLSEIVMPSTEAAFALQHVIPYIAARIELLRPYFIHCTNIRGWPA